MGRRKAKALWEYGKGDICPCCMADEITLDRESCYCSAISHPPCSACEKTQYLCPTCDFNPSEHGETYITEYHNQTRESKMLNHQINTMLYIENGAQTVGMAYDGALNSKVYTFLIDPDLHKSLKAGDFLLIEGKSELNFPRLARVTELHPTPQVEWESNTHYKWVAALDNPAFFVEVKEREKKLHLAMQRAEARRRLSEAVSELSIDAAKLLAGGE